MGPTLKQIEQIIRQQVQLKKDPADIFKMAEKASIPTPQITSIFMQMGLPIPTLNNQPKEVNADRELEDISTTSKNEIWDPLGQEIDPEIFNEINQKVQKKIDRYIASPKTTIRNLLIASIPGIIVLGFFILSFNGIFEQIGNTPDSETIPNIFSRINIQWVFFAFFPAILYWAYVSNFQRDSIKLLVAQKKGWLYNSGQSQKRWLAFNEILPEIFNKSGYGQQIEDEFWGTINNRDFYASNFRYIKGRGKHKKTYYSNIMSLKLPNKNIANFQLKSTKAYLWSPFERFLGPKKLATESVEFNNNFTVLYNDDEEVAQDLEITKTLSPAVQEALVKFKAKAQIESIIFREGVLTFQFYGRLLPKIYTNFFKDMKLDERDMNAVEDKILKIIEIGDGIIKYLD